MARSESASIANEIPQLLLNEAEARKALGGISRASLWNYRKAGLPYVRLPGRVMFSPTDLQSWINDRRVAPAK
jgi:hypothetical protein